jgi:16S rRNA G966 N2-methylase RsmD
LESGKVKIDHTLLTTLRKYLDEMMYSLMDFRLSFHLQMSSPGFPTIQSLRSVVQQLDAPHSVLFRLFRIGESVDDESVKSALPANVFEALVELELLIPDKASEWRTPNVLIVPAEGLYLLVGIPPSYSTSRHTGFELSSSIMARALPVSCSGLKVLDIGSGSGIQGLLCARRGADSVVGLELNNEAVLIARANAILNGLDGKADFRQSDELAALDESERFDFVLISGEPSSLEDLLEKLPAYLQPRASGQLIFIERGKNVAPGELRIYPLFTPRNGLAPHANQNLASETTNRFWIPPPSAGVQTIQPRIQ